jgi:hypothetical protein
MKKIKIIPGFVLMLIAPAAISQEIVQTVRGSVTDKVTQAPLPGVLAVLVGSQPLKAAQTDGNGIFRIDKVPVGEQSLKITVPGYKDVVMNHVTVNSGKELVLQVNMEEDPEQMEEVKVIAAYDKHKALNEMSGVSTRAFSVEETQKFAAAVNDPARMATSFAGVVAPSDGNNHISIRGNSPNGLLWRMEGIEIPNPNHFANVGTSGGGISILSAQLLNNSDFSTGAFAAEYGNALSGVFDLRLRKGNNQKREYTFQAGVLGIDVAAEGPFKKGSDASFLVNYRYSTLSILGKIGVPLGDGITNFQDLSFNLSFPGKKMGSFSIFGFGGLSSQTTEHLNDSLKWKEDYFYRINSNYFANTGMVGFTNTKLFEKGYLKTILGVSATQNGYVEEEMNYDYVTSKKTFQQVFNQNKITLSSVYTHKMSSLSSFRTGIILNRLGYDLSQSDRQDDTLRERINNDGKTQTCQGFFQWNYKLTQKLTTNIGWHYYHVMLNNTNSFEPRASIRYEVNGKNIVTYGYGLHSQIQPLGVYFAKAPGAENPSQAPNKNLGLSKAHHFVLGYDRILTQHSHLKTEVYYQYLFNIPVSPGKQNPYSILNAFDGYYTDPLVNEGTGVNKGIELTYERFMHKNLYWLVTGSLYDSKFRTADGRWFNTRYNTNYALNVTAGKEWTLRGTKSRTLGFNVKSMFVGGYRVTPIDLEASIAEGTTRFKTDSLYTNKNPDYYRLDIRVSLKRNYKKVTTTLALDLQNSTNRKNVGGQYYDAHTGKIKYWYQAPLIPVLSYRVEF